MTSPAPELLRELAVFSARIGSDPMQIQAAGGNTSLKHDGVLWVKASGKWLANAMTEDVFAPIALDRVRRGLSDGASDPVSAHVLRGTLRPSIETTFHAWLDSRFVAHTHSINILSFAVRDGGERELADHLSGLDWTYLPYVRPGLPLSRLMAERISPAARIIVLGSHGLIVGGDSVADVEALLADIEARVATPMRQTPPPAGEKLIACAPDGWVPADDDRLHAIATDPLSLSFARLGPVCPDQVVFLGPDIPLTPLDGRAICAIAGAGVLTHRSLSAGQRDMLLGLSLLYPRLAAGSVVMTLPPEEIRGLVNWDAELYRMSLDGRG